MSNEVQKDIPESVQSFLDVQKAFDFWRENRRRGEHIPKELWEKAVSLHPAFSIHQISRTLRLDFVGLRKRLGITPSGEGTPAGEQDSPFIELPGLSRPCAEGEHWSDCRISVKRSCGSRMRVTIRKAPPCFVADVLRVLAGRLG